MLAVSKLKELVNRRKKKIEAIPSENSTSRIYLGWMHNNGKSWKVVGPEEGGEKLVIDLPKECDYPTLQKEITDTYFPYGHL